MTSLIILFDGFAYSIGLLNLFLAVLLYVRDRDILYVREFVLMISFTAIVVVQSLEAANGGTLPPWFFPGGTYLNDFGISLLVFALPWYIHHLEPRPYAFIPDIAFMVAAGLSLASSLVAHILVGLGLHDFVPQLGAVRIVACIVSTVYTILLAVIVKIGQYIKQIRHPERQVPESATAKTAVRMGLITLILLPVLLYLDFGANSVVGMPGMRGFNILPIIYVLWSILLMNLRVRTILAVIGGPAGMDQPTMAEFNTKFQISPRESEVLDRLAQGQTYDSIADELCISLSTAKTHISRIYRKTGVTNKVELVHLLQTTAQNSKISRKDDTLPA